jgi:hypothetical protein
MSVVSASRSLVGSMSDKPAAQNFPRRDEHGRAISVAELTFAALGGLMIAFVALLIIDGVLAVFGLATFLTAPGWLGLILPALVYFDDLRGWRGHAVRFAVAFLAAVAGIGLGLLVAGQFDGLPPLVTGAIGALIATVVYSPAWFFGVRWSTGQHSEMGSS